MTILQTLTKKKKALLLALCLAGLCAACSRDDAANSMMPTAMDDAQWFVTEEEAMEKLREFDESHIATRAEERTIACVETLHRSALGTATRNRTSDDTPLAYIVNFAEGGYAVVRAASRQGGVVARVEKGSMDAATLAAAKQSIDKAEAEADIDLATYVNGKVALQLLQAIERAPEADEVSEAAALRSTRGTPIGINLYKLKTEWDQWSPFNQYYYQQTGNNYPVGCVALALAQVMIYNKHKHDVGINSFNANTTPLLPQPYYPIWQFLTRTLENPTPAIECQMELSKFLYHIGKSVHMQYYSTVSKTDTSFAIGFLNKIPGYKNVVEKAANFQDIKKMLDADNLVYIDGQAKTDNGHYYKGEEISGGHAWVIDGYDVKIDLLPGWSNGQQITIQKETRLVHCRFGYKGYLDGWYEFTNSNTLVSEVYRTEEMIYYTL